jgi:uncharacterized protein (DUF305 family)
MKPITSGIIAIAVLMTNTAIPAIGQMHHRGGMMGGGMMGMMRSGAQSDRSFNEMMIPHHKMALMMTAHIVDSDRPELRTLAKNILRTQTAEIDKMRQWYRTWYR